MFKLRRMPVRRCRENCRFPERSTKERIKCEGNSNITSKRVTIPPSFLCHRLRSRKIQKSPFKFRRGYDSDRDLFVPPDGQDLNENCHKPRRSARISRKTEEVRNYTRQTASQYYYNCLQNSPPKETPKNTSHIVRNNSNSLFREINERCSRLKPKRSTDFEYPVSAVIDPQSKVERFYPGVFCVNLFREVTLGLQQRDYLSDCKRAIADKIRDINRQLSGEMNPRHGNPEKTKPLEVDEERNDFIYIPRSAWVFQTPPRQRVAVPKPAESAIQPAVICTANRRNNLYELHPSFHVDLTGVSSGENVELDGRYMRHLASFGENGEAVRSFGMGNVREGYSGCHSNVSDLFQQVLGRPTKTVKKKSRTDKFYERRGREGPEDTPTGGDPFESVGEFDGDVTFVKDNGTFKMVATQASQNESFGFKFRKNLFKGDEEKVFNFDTAEPKMFNFAELDKKEEKFKMNIFEGDDEKVFNFDAKEPKVFEF